MPAEDVFGLILTPDTTLGSEPPLLDAFVVPGGHPTGTQKWNLKVPHSGVCCGYCIGLPRSLRLLLRFRRNREKGKPTPRIHNLTPQ